MKIKEIIEKIKENANEILTKLDKDNLKKLIDYLDDKYYNDGITYISDQLYDVIKDYYDDTYKTDTTETKIGHKVDKDEIKLPYYMSSLEKIKPSTSRFNLWIKKYSGPYIISYKLDGISAMLYKKNENEIYLYTRGDGYFGKSITHILKYLQIDTTKLRGGDAIRGELIMSKQNFEKFKKNDKNEKDEKNEKKNNDIKNNNMQNNNTKNDLTNEIDTIKNSRNVVGGLIKNENSTKQQLSMIDFITYDVMNMEDTYTNKLNYLKNINMTVIDYETINDNLTLDFLSKKLVDARAMYKYAIDGLVVYDNSKYHKIISGKKPKYAFAYKQVLTDQLAESTVISVVWNISRTKHFKPIIMIEPIELLDSKISKMTGANAKFIEDNAIGPGAVIEVIKSGDIIPNLNRVIKKSDSGVAQMPSHNYTWNATHVDIIPTDLTDELIETITLKKINFFFDTFDIKYIGEGVIKKLIQNKYDDLWKILTAKKEDLYKLKGFKQKGIDKIYESIDKGLTNRELYEIMTASQTFGRNIGLLKFKAITDMYPNIIDLYKNNTREELEKLINVVPNFDTKTTNKIIDNFDSFIVFYNELIKLKPNAVKQNAVKVNKNANDLNNINDTNNVVRIIDINDLPQNKYNIEQFKGKKLAFTGEKLKDKELQKEIEDSGGEITESVSRKTDYVITKDINSNSSKIKKAKELEITIMTIDEFFKIVYGDV